MEAEGSSEILAQTTRCHNSEYLNINHCVREILTDQLFTIKPLKLTGWYNCHMFNYLIYLNFAHNVHLWGLHYCQNKHRLFSEVI